MTKTEQQAWYDERFAELTTGKLTAGIKGSDKQISWATDIRARMIVNLRDDFGAVDDTYPDGTRYEAWAGIKGKDELDAAIRMLLRIATAAWWINHRYDGSNELYTEATALIAKERGQK